MLWHLVGRGISSPVNVYLFGRCLLYLFFSFIIFGIFVSISLHHSEVLRDQVRQNECSCVPAFTSELGYLYSEISIVQINH